MKGKSVQREQATALQAFYCNTCHRALASFLHQYQHKLIKSRGLIKQNIFCMKHTKDRRGWIEVRKCTVHPTNQKRISIERKHVL